MTDKLYTVTLADTFVVLAKDREAAEHIALEHRGEATLEATWVFEMDHYPGDWDEDSMPYGVDGEAPSIGALVAQGAAPRMKQERP